MKKPALGGLGWELTLRRVTERPTARTSVIHGTCAGVRLVPALAGYKGGGLAVDAD